MNYSPKMKIKFPIFQVLLSLFSIFSTGQDNEAMIWYDASLLPIHGKLDTANTAPFQRFPPKMEDKVREQVWQLSKNSAGLYLDFKTDAINIIIHYQLEDELAFPHMPATGVSGLDLYAHEEKEDWQWVKGKYSFKNTITYRFSNIKPLAKKELRVYRLYLPLYSSLKWMQVGVAKSEVLKGLYDSDDKPIVVYGTSIVQGACASRPGMAWPNILGRKSGRPVINLGFSGNGRLEPEIIDFLRRTDASIYVLDCMANFTSGQGLNPEEAEKRIAKAVNDIRALQPEIPILLVEHAGYSDGNMQPARKITYVELNRATENVFKKLKAQKTKFLYLLKKEEIGLAMDSFVDGTHPNDYGMLKYANALKRKLDKIIK